MTDDARLAAIQARCIPVANDDGYEVSADGRVFSVRSNWRGYGRRELRQVVHSDGYLHVRFSNKRGQRTHRPVHRVVCIAFHGPCPFGLQARHLDGNKLNNSASNLAWGTAAENAADRDSHGSTARGERNGFSKLTSESADSIRLMYDSMGLSQREIARLIGVSQRCVGMVIRGETWRR